MMLIFNAFAKPADASCPFGFDSPERVPAGQNPTIHGRVAPKGYLEAVAKLDFNAVKDDLKALFLDSKDFWPADYGTYAPFMVRLTWHSAGSYRIRDGRGGVDGGRMRFDPERSWDDNTNLDKARTLLEPIKQKYGVGLSWGDLFVLAGDAAIESMGGPTIGFCGGRIDDSTGFWSERLGPNAVQEAVEPCPEPPCELQAAVQVGLVYVNPEGAWVDGELKVDPTLSAPAVRETFARMGMNDTETVALVGGGHAFGKTHGACPDGAGPSPMEDPENPWPGNCGTGIGPDVTTSGFEGPWTSNPYKWDNEYFSNLLDYEWEEHTGKGGKQQWRSITPGSRDAPDVTKTSREDLMMTTADLSLKFDSEYTAISEKFKADPAYLDQQFAEAWYKLMTRDMGPRERCLGNLVPPARDFQNPLPAPPMKLANFDKVKEEIRKALKQMPYGKVGDNEHTLTSDYTGYFVRLAWRCAATHRVTDYTGGCNGARIMLAPQKLWPINAGLNKPLDALEPIKAMFDGLSWADLIVLAGNTALEEAGAREMPFCGGRTDATKAGDAGVQEPLLDEDITNSLDDLQESALLLGVSQREFTALMGHHSINLNVIDRGFMGPTDSTPMKLDNEYYQTLLKNDWAPVMTGKMQYRDQGDQTSYILRSDYLLTIEPTFRSAAQDFATDNDMFLDEFAAAWTKVMNADRFDGPTGNLCEPYLTQAELEASSGGGGSSDDEHLLIGALIMVAVLFIVSLSWNMVMCCRSKSEKESGVELSMAVPKGSYDQGQQNSPRANRESRV